MIDPTTGQRISSLYAYERLDPLAIANRQSNDMENMQSLIEASSSVSTRRVFWLTLA
jgi:hypothetical protein